MLYHVKSANLLMRAADFDNNEYSDCVGIHVKDIRIITDPRIGANLRSTNSRFSTYWTWNSILKQSEMTPEEYIRLFSRSVGFCLL